jgi:ketosteroid isomerase-like protein
MTILRIFVLVLAIAASAPTLIAQNTNSSSTGPARPRTTNTNQPSKAPAATATPPATETEQPSAPSTAPKAAAKKPVVSTQTPSASDGVLAAFNGLLDGIRHANVDEVMGQYWNSRGLSLFNYNGTVTKGWDQVRKNRESSYPEIKDVKLDVRDVSVTMLGRDGAAVTCLWTQSQVYKGSPETASGRMTLIFKKVGTAWKAIHLHSSSDNPNPAVVPASEAAPKPSPTPIP